MVRAVERDEQPSWFSEVDALEQLEQGDIVLDCPLIQPVVAKQYKKISSRDIEGERVEHNVIIMSQSCDLAARKIEIVLVCPFFTLTHLGEIDGEYVHDKKKEKLREGIVAGMHLLSKCLIDDKEDFIVVDFKQLYTIPLKLLNAIAAENGKRQRLISPYREHLSQAFARFFMRVGLPADIPKFA